MAKKKTPTDDAAKPTEDQGAAAAVVATDAAAAPDPAPEPVAPRPKPGRPAVLVGEANQRKDDNAISLLIDACQRFGVDPDGTLPEYRPTLKPDVRTRELAAWRFYPGDPNAGEPDSVVIVTAGGVKLRHYADPDHPVDEATDAALARIFQAFRRQKDGTIERIPLPDDLTLPLVAVTGVPNQGGDYRYQAGYLKGGGKTEAARRAARRGDQ